MSWTRDDMAARAAQELSDGDYVNLGIGIPTLVPEYLPADVNVIIHAENGLLGVGTWPTPEEYDPDIINAAKETVSIRKGGSYFDSATSFAMIRGGRVKTAILGAFQVSQHGDIANWAVPGQMIKGIGGAMDLVAGAARVIVIMSHASKAGVPKLVERCTLPLTGKAVVDRVITDLGVFDIGPDSIVAIELAPGVSESEVTQKTAASLSFSHPSPQPTPAR